MNSDHMVLEVMLEHKSRVAHFTHVFPLAVRPSVMEHSRVTDKSFVANVAGEGQAVGVPLRHVLLLPVTIG